MTVERDPWPGSTKGVVPYAVSVHAGLMLTILPVTVPMLLAGAVLTGLGLVGLGMPLFVLGLLLSMFVFGAGMPRPDPVPRPGEEDAYTGS